MNLQVILKKLAYNSSVFILALTVLSISVVFSQVSDDFSKANINKNLWSFVNPKSDANFLISNESGNNFLQISVPGGVDHVGWSTGNNFPRLIQSVANVDFDVQTKFISGVSGTNQIQGIWVGANSTNFIRFDIYSGSGVFAYSGTFVSLQPTTKLNQSIASQSVYYLRVIRTQNTWSMRISSNGTSWTELTSFVHPINVTELGVYAGNAGSNPPAFNLKTDFFFNSLSPINPEDQAAGQDAVSPWLYSLASESTAPNAIKVKWSTDELTKGTLQYGLTSNCELGSSSSGNFTFGETVTIGSLSPATRYYYKLTVVDASGNSSSSPVNQIDTPAPSGNIPEITILDRNQMSFGSLGNPQKWLNIRGSVNHLEEIASVTYSLNNGPSKALSLGADLSRLSGIGDFNIELGVSSLINGQNDVNIKVQTVWGEIVSDAVQVNYQKGQVWPANFTANWSTVSKPSEVAQIVDGKWAIEGSNKLRTMQIGYDRLVAIGDTSWKDYQVTVPITIHSIGPNGFQTGSNSPALGIAMRWTGHVPDGNQPSRQWWPLGSLGILRWTNQSAPTQVFKALYGTTGGYIATQPNENIQFGQTYIFKAQVQGHPATYRLKIWKQGDTEPASWMSATVGSGEPGQGSILLLAHHVDASFGQVEIVSLANTPTLTISNLNKITTSNSLALTWNTNIPASRKVRYGYTAAFELGTDSSNTLVQNHNTVLSGLSPNTQIYYKVIVSAASGKDSVSGTAMTAQSGAVQSVVSDDFSQSTLNQNLWSFINPVGNGSYFMNGTQLNLVVPAGSNHEPWKYGNKSVRVMQAIHNVDFQAEVKFESPLNGSYSCQGIIVESNPENFLRFEFYSNGSTIYLFAGSISIPSGSTLFNVAIPSSSQYFMRVTKVGNQWTQSYSLDGVNWIQGTVFSQSLSVSAIGVFAGNTGDNPAHTAIVDYFFNTASPIVPEDANATPNLSTLSHSSTPNATGAQIGWTTNLNSNSLVTYGLTHALELGQKTDPAFTTSHSLAITQLNSSKKYFYQIRSQTASGSVTSTALDSFTTLAAPGQVSALVSDDFSASSLNTSLWQVVDPVGDGLASVTGTQLSIRVAPGSGHDPWSNANRATRVRQAAANGDFEIEVKFESGLNGRYQGQGIMVEASPSEFLRFDFYSSGTSVYLFAASISGSSAQTRYNSQITASANYYLRVKRVGNTWTQSYSSNGTTWYAGANFTQSITVTTVGVMAFDAGNNPGHTALVDYFFNTASPIVPEDQGAVELLSLSNVVITPDVNTALINWTSNHASDSRVSYGLSSALELGTVVNSAMVSNHTVTLSNLTPSTVYYYRIISQNTSGGQASSPVGTFTTKAVPPPVQNAVSDEFNQSSLNQSLWSFVNPLGDGSFSSTGSKLVLNVGPGVGHDLWSFGNNSVRVMQASSNQNFEIVVKFDSQLSGSYRGQGILIQASNNNFLRFDFYSSGSNVYLFAANINGNSAQSRYNSQITSGTNYYMRVRRIGNQWTQEYSLNGSTWTPGANFSYTLDVKEVGVFASDAGTNPGHSAVVDYFHITP